MENNSKPRPIDWNGDPELRKIYQEFVASLAGRAEQLKKCLAGLKSGNPQANTYDEIQKTAHQLAGAAGTYGFGSLTDLGGALDDWIECRGYSIGTDGPTITIRYTQILLDALEEACSLGKDPSKTRARPESTEFISVVEALASESTS